MIALWLLACLPLPEAAPAEPLLLAGQVSLTTDHTLQRSELRIHTFTPDLRPAPAERQGVPMGECATLVPRSAGEGLVLRRAQVSAACAGQPVALEEVAPGLVAHTFPGMLPTGTSCAVTVDDQEIALPALPPAPDVRFGVARSRWTPVGADELRIVVPRTAGRNTICRLPDTGVGPEPRGARHTLAFASHHRMGLSTPDPSGARVAVTVSSGVWMTP